jgi:LDH2 family malate/lactate/ureidoglycolate dehydrogenase
MYGELYGGIREGCAYDRTSPISIAIPGGDEAPLALDMGAPSHRR